MRDYSNTFKEKTASINAPETPVIMLEITHPDLLDAVRVVNDNQDLISNGHTFTALAFRLTPPDDLSQGAPRAELAVDNVGRDLTAWVETSGGAEGAQVRMLQVLRSDPDVVEWEVTMELSNVSITPAEVRGTLVFPDLLNRPGIPMVYRPENTPGLF